MHITLILYVTSIELMLDQGISQIYVQAQRSLSLVSWIRARNNLIEKVDCLYSDTVCHDFSLED